MKTLTRLTIFLVLILISARAVTQNDLVHPMLYTSHDQNMWGPDTAYGINVDHTFFDITIDESWGFSEVEEFLGQQFGVGMDLGIFAMLRSSFEAHGFYTGSFSLDYPVEVTLDFPEDYPAPDYVSYGGPATIKTSYEVTDGWNLETSFPPVGVITLDLEYQFDPFMDILICVFSCDTIHLIPASVEVPHTIDTLFHINAETEYCIYPCYVGGEFQFCHDYELPIDIDFTDLVGFEFEAHVDLPNVETEDYIEPGTNCLIAQGDDPYMDVSLDVIGFLYVMAGFIPPPEGPQIQEAIDFLNDTISYPISTPLGDIVFQIEYSLLSVYFIITNTLNQDIYFCPTIWATLDFPLEVPYAVNDPNNGYLEVESGFSDTVTLAVGNDITITYPCHDWDSLYVGVKYNIQPTIRNHTWDSIAFSFVIEALSADITIITPFKSQIAPAVMPEFILPLASNQPIKSPPIPYAGYYETETDIKGGDKDIGPWHIGPLFEWTISLGYVPVTWFDQTWELMHFEEDLVFPGQYIRPYDKSEVNALLFTNGAYCHGQPYGYVYAEAQNGVEPFDFEWSTGDLTYDLYTDTDSIYGIPGFYTVTITDSNNCESYDSITVAVNPPLLLELNPTDLTCYGFFTGSIETIIEGGTEPYYFNWSNGSIVQSPDDLTSGWYYVTIHDFVNCAVTDSAFIDQPESPVTIDVVPTHLPCHGTDYGSIDISLSGATPPYSVEWSSGQTYQDLHSIPAGVYTVSVTDANDCLWTESVTIIEPDTLITNISSSDIPCFGYDNGILNAQTTGGTAPYHYYWFHDLNNNSQIITNMHPGFYFVSVVDANGCSDTASTTISQPDELVLDFVVNHVSCKGGHDGYIIVTPSGGVPDYSISWSNLYYTDSIGYLYTGPYTVTVMDDNGCPNIETIVINEPLNSLNSDFFQINNVSCFGFSDASANVQPTGGTSPYYVAWEDGVSQDNFIGFGMPANVFYNITVTDENNCVYFDSIKFTQPPILNLSGITNPVTCGVAAGSGSVNASGGTPPFGYLWSDGETSQNASALPAGENFVVVTDSHSCKDTLELTVLKTGKIYGDYSILSQNQCFKDSLAIAEVRLEEGFEPKTFVWTNGFIGDTAENLPAGNYQVYASDRFNCTDTIELTITHPDSIIPNFVLTEPSCSAVFDGEIEAIPSGGTPVYTYLWDNNSENSKISEVREGIYYLTITDQNDCSFIYMVDLPEAEFCVIIYNTITPNNDGSNDVWIIENIEQFERSQIWIYNRVGNLVYEVENYQNDWGGTFNGKDLPEGTYYYIIDLGNGKDPIKGHVTIIR